MTPRFPTTVWARIRASGDGDTRATHEFMARYRAPLLRYAMRQGLSSHDAEDVIQDVLLKVLDRNLLAEADQARGRFRSYLVGITKNVLRDRRKKLGRQKRGGGQDVVALDEVDPPAAPSSEPAFDVIWGEHLLLRALAQLEERHLRQHELIQLRFRDGLTNRQIAERMELTLQQVKNDFNRARQTLIKSVRSEILHYASSEEEYQEELTAFMKLLGPAYSGS